ncbi:MAG TPA: MFS transporter [Chloroflexi bacterium]|nr:MFS transporter [Chloroflexota bacterium]HBY07545.1 MFS transporter [Chloroflexota bacterium]
MSLHIPPALTHRRFRLLWIGVLISVAGSRMQFAAILWHINQLSSQPIALGMIGLSRVIPVIIFSLVGGAIADVFDRRKILFVTQIVLISTAGMLAWLTWSDQIQLWHIYILTVIEAIASAFDLPARQALTPNLLPAKDLPNAFSLQSIAFTIGAIFGPALGGLFIGYFGQTSVYLINAISYLGIVIALGMIGPVAQEHSVRKGAAPVSWEAIKEGIQFILSRPIILSSMLLDFFATFFAAANALMPIFAKDILGVGEIGYGWLLAAESVGSAFMAVILSQVQELRHQGKILLGAVISFGIWTIIFGISRWYWVTFVALALMGASDTVSMVIRNTIRQLRTPDYIRGRMVSVTQIFFMGGPQLGELEAGLVAQFFGAPIAVITGGIGTILIVFGIAKKWPQLVTYDGSEDLPPQT